MRETKWTNRTNRAKPLRGEHITKPQNNITHHINKAHEAQQDTITPHNTMSTPQHTAQQHNTTQHNTTLAKRLGTTTIIHTTRHRNNMTRRPVIPYTRPPKIGKYCKNEKGPRTDYAPTALSQRWLRITFQVHCSQHIVVYFCLFVLQVVVYQS